MSWEGYIEHLQVELPHGGTLSSSAIVGQDGGLWASSPGFPPLTPDEVATIVLGFKECEEEAGGFSRTLGERGLVIGGHKFRIVPGGEGVLRGKSKGGGCTVRRTNTALVVGIYEEPVTPADCNVVVEQLGEYLAEQNY